MGEVILMNVFSNLKEWVDRTAEASEKAKQMKEAKLKKQAKMGRGTRRVMRLVRSLSLSLNAIFRLTTHTHTVEFRSSKECKDRG